MSGLTNRTTTTRYERSSYHVPDIIHCYLMFLHQYKDVCALYFYHNDKPQDPRGQLQQAVRL